MEPAHKKQEKYILGREKNNKVWGRKKLSMFQEQKNSKVVWND